MMTPPFLGNALRISSGTFLGLGERRAQAEWLAITGASGDPGQLAIVSGETWEMSTSMPTRFISRDDALTEQEARGGGERRWRRRPSRA